MAMASGLSMAATGLGAIGSVANASTTAANERQQADQTAKYDEFRATQLQDASQAGIAKAAETDTYLRQRTMTMLGNLMATTASANLDPNSPTGAAIAARTQGQNDQARSIKVGDLNAQATEDARESWMYTDSARDTLNRAYANADNSMLGGILGGLGSVAKGLSGINFG